MTLPCTGKYVTIRRAGLPVHWAIVFNIMEMRVFQIPNLLQVLEGIATISAPTPKSTQYKATNLITHLDSRTSGNGLSPLIDQASNRAPYDSCYRTTEVQLGPLGHKMIITIDLGKPHLVHALLVV